MKKTKSNSDHLLFENIKKGDCKSFEDLFSIYYNPLCNFAYLFIQDRQIAEEVVSDVFLNIWNKRLLINIKLNIKSYLYKSTKNAVISKLRKQQPQLVHLDEVRGQEGFENPETLMIQSEKKEFFNKIIAALPKKAGLVFRMHKVDGLKYREIAEILSLSEKTVENHMGNAIKHLRKLVQKHPEIIRMLMTATIIGISWCVTSLCI